MLSRKIFENSDIAMAISVLFKQFLGKFYLKFLLLMLMCLLKYDAYCLHIFDFACWRGVYCYLKDSK